MPNFFPILIEVEEVAVGRVLRKLSALEGVAHIRLKLMEERRQQLTGPEEDLEVPVAAKTPLISKGPNTKMVDGRSLRHMTPHENTAYRAIMEVLRHTPAHLKILGAALGRAGLYSGRISGYVNRMEKLKLLRRTSPGTYRATEKGLKDFFSEKPSQRALPAPPWQNRGKPTDNKTGFRNFVLTTLKAELENDPDHIGVMSNADLKAKVVEEGYSDKNLSTTGMKMRQEGLVEYNNGFYSIKERGLEALMSPPESEVNSNASTEGLTANG